MYFQLGGNCSHPNIRLLPLLFPLLMVGLAGCSQLNMRTGPAPILDVTSIDTATSNQIEITNALARDAGLNADGTVDYYRVAEAGFNYVDDQCQAYFDEMYFIDRGRSQVKSALAAASSTTAAILGVTNASTLTLSVVASAFGFASTATDIVAGTYLYALPPATTQGLVDKLKAAYRDQASNMRAEITTPTAAYHHIQSYLALCLPPRIEAEIVSTVSAAGAQVVQGNSGSTFAVESVPASTGPTPRQQRPAPPAPKPPVQAPKPQPQPKAPLQPPVQPTVIKVTVAAIDSILVSMQTQLATFDKETPLSTLQKNLDLANKTQGVSDSQKKNLADKMRLATSAHKSMNDAVQHALSFEQTAQGLKNTTDIGAKATDLVNQANQARSDFDKASAQFEAAKGEIMNFAL